MNNLVHGADPFTAEQSALIRIARTATGMSIPDPDRTRISNTYVGTRRLWAAQLDARRSQPDQGSCDVQLRIAQQENAELQSDNARLRRKAVRLARMVARARHYAQHDELTGLPTRRLLIDRCRQALSQARRKHEQVGFMMIDLNGFKRINDRFGHEAGDDLLKHVATCLVSCVRRSDTVCRYGGDEFVIMLPGLDDHERMFTLGTKIHTRLRTHYAVQGETIGIAGSIGTSIFPSDGDTFRLLMKQADISMYWSKSATARSKFPIIAADIGSR